MRLTLATLLLMASAPAWSGEPLVADAPAAEPAAGAPSGASAPTATGAAAPTATGVAAPTAPAVPTAPTAPTAPAVPYAGLYDSPLFGHLAPAVDRVDETALRFYAGQKNRARVDAEIRRLRALHPAWRVPANLYASGAGNDEQPLWDLFAAGRTEELRSAIQAREKREAGWRPSADLLAKMARAETAAQLKALSDAKDWARLLSLASARPDVLSCSAVDLDWRVAEAFAALGAFERSYEVDAAILKGCRDRDERLATVRKAVDALPAAAVDRLIAAGAVLADGSGEFDAVRLDLARRQIGRALSTAAGSGAGAGAGANDGVAAADLDALSAATLRSGDAADAALLGWYGYGQGRWAEADGWFKLALGSGGDVKVAEGHALALKELGRFGEAERLAHAWRERSPTMRGLFVSLMTARLATTEASAVDAGEMADFTSILMADRSSAAAGALGWAAYGRGDLDAAALWFGRAVDWSGTGSGTGSDTGPDAGDVPDKVAEGWALTLKRLGRFDAAEDFLHARIGRIERDPRGGADPGQAGTDRAAAARALYVAVAVSALSGGPLPGAIGPALPIAAVSPERMDRFAAVIAAARSVPGAAALGWRALRDGRPAEAADRFRDALAWSPEGPADLTVLEGLVLSLKDAGRLAEAEDAAYPRIRDSAQLRDSYRGIMVAQLSTPALAERLTPERVLRFAALAEAESSSAGAEALGWYRLNASNGATGTTGADGGGCGYAADWFRRAVAWSPDHAGTAKANEGLAQALARAGHPLAADDVLAAWADRSPDMRALDVKLMADALTRDLFPAAVDEGRLTRFAALVRADRSATGAQAMGWHRYRDAGEAYGVDWFADAVRWSPDRRPDAKTVEGYASALRDVGRLAEAEEVLFPFVDRVPVMRNLYIDTVVSELTLDNPPEPMPHDRLARFIAVATPLRSAAAAQAVGWYRFARREYPDAAIWFKLAVDWWPALPADADRYTYVPEGFRPVLAHLALKPEDYRRTPRAFTSRVHGPDASLHRYVDTFGGLATTWTGYALTLDALGRTAEAEDIAFAWRDRWPALGRMFVDLAIRTLTRGGGCGAGLPGGAAAAAEIAPERLKRFAAVIEEERDAGGAAALGWAAAARHDPAEAAVWLKAAIDWRPTDAALDGRAMAGYVAALRASGRAEEAYAAASAWAEGVPEVKAGLLDAALDMLSADSTASADKASTDKASNDGKAPAVRPSPEALARAVAMAEADGSARGPAALGWYYLNTKRPALALPRFKLAVERAGDPAKASAGPAAGPAAGPTAAPAAPDGCAAPARAADAASVSDADVLPKAVEGFALALRAAGRDADALTFVEAWSAKVPALAALPGDIVAEIVSRGAGGGVGSGVGSGPGRDGGQAPLSADMLDRLAAAARRGRSAPAAAAFAWSAYDRRDWNAAAAWFADGIAWSPDGRGPVKLVEGYAASLHNACRFGEAERAALSRSGGTADEDADGRLRNIYVDSVADRVARLRAGAALAPADAARLAATTVAVSSSNGAQALGWYAYRSRQFAAAASWFEKALDWRATEAQAYGLALSYRRLGDGANLARVLAAYESRYPSLAAVRRAGIGGREPPVPDFGDLARRGCAGAQGAVRTGAAELSADEVAATAGRSAPPGRQTAQGAAQENAQDLAPGFPQGLVPQVAAVLAASAPAEVAAARAEAAMPPTEAAPPPADAAPLFHRRPVMVVADRTSDARRADAERAEPERAGPEPRSHPRRSVPVLVALRTISAPAAAAPAADEPGRGAPDARAGDARPVLTARADIAPSGSAGAALAAKDYTRCLAILARHPVRTAADREIEGWCLLGAKRPAEAAEAFRAAGTHASGRVAGDSALGETLSHLADGDTEAAVGSAGRAPIGADKRRDLGLQIMSRQALDAYRAGRWADALDALRRRAGYAREPRDLTMLRGWSLYHEGDYAAARAAFAAADALLSDRDSRGALATVDSATTNKAFR